MEDCHWHHAAFWHETPADYLDFDTNAHTSILLTENLRCMAWEVTGTDLDEEAEDADGEGGEEGEEEEEAAEEVSQRRWRWEAE